MVTSGHQIGMGRTIQGEGRTREGDQHVVQRSARHAGDGAIEGQVDPQKGMKIKQEYNELTDVMFVDLLPLQEGSNVTVIDRYW